jgi:hypothetical protein
LKRSFSQRHENSDVFLSAKTGLEQTNAVVMVQHYKSGVLGNESDCPLPVRKRAFLRHFILKTIILPRQARDKHRESTQKRRVSAALTRCPGRRLHQGLLLNQEQLGHRLGCGKRPFCCAVISLTHSKTMNCQDRLGTNARSTGQKRHL